MAVCIAVVGKDDAPLYVGTADLDKELNMHYKVHSALDVVEEKAKPANKGSSELKELYLGLLYPTENHKIYGYVTNTKIKFVIVVDSSNIALRESDIRVMFRNLHALYTDVVCNPFYIPGEPITSKSFDSAIQKMMGGHA